MVVHQKFTYLICSILPLKNYYYYKKESSNCTTQKIFFQHQDLSLQIQRTWGLPLMLFLINQQWVFFFVCCCCCCYVRFLHLLCAGVYIYIYIYYQGQNPQLETWMINSQNTMCSLSLLQVSDFGPLNLKYQLCRSY